MIPWRRTEVKHEFAVMLVVETSDPRLGPEAINEAAQTAGGVARLRRAVLQHLPKDVQRLVAVFPVEHARMLMHLHEAVGEDIAKELGHEGDFVFVRPPPDYIPPTTE